MRLKEQDFEKIITDRLIFNRKNEDIAKDIGCGVSTVTAVTQMFKLVKTQDFEHIRTIMKTNTGRIGQLKWAAKKLNIEIPDDVFSAREEHLAKQQAQRDMTLDEFVKAQPLEESKEVIEELKTAPVIAEKNAEKNDVLYFIKILEALHKQNELLEQLCDVVIPHWMCDLKDNINTNTDVTCERLKNMEQTLDGIKCNTRKRGS